MEIYQLNYILHEPSEEHGGLYMAEIRELPGCDVWGKTAKETLDALPTVARQFILSYKGSGEPLPEAVKPFTGAKGEITVAVETTPARE